MNTLLARLIGAHLPKAIAIFAVTLREAECAVRHARGAGGDLPIRVFCAEALPPDTAPIDGCVQFIPDATASVVRRELQGVWVALSIVAWTGERRALRLKFLPFLLPPFRVLVLNEAEGFFAAKPGAIADHALRRLRDASISAFRRTRELSASLVYRAGERVSDVARLTGSLAYRTGERAGDLAFIALAFVAQGTSPLSRFAIRRLRGGTPMALPIGPASNSNFIEVTIPGRAWPRRKILNALSSSSAEFVVFRKPGETGDPASLIHRAREANAFAVAKQTAYSHWRKRVLTKHPFRRLQPGEVSQVFAPWSSLMVLRRRTLLELGCPHALTCGAALQLLFWQASAAGLHSFVAGHDGEVTDEHAMALEDAELALRITAAPRLAALGPAHPAAYRGNVARSPSHARAFRGKPRVLVVSPYLPFPLSHGGAVRIYNLCRSMSPEIDFVLACFREAKETVRYDALHEVFREVYIVDADERHADPAVPKQVAEYRNSAMADLIRTLCREGRIDGVQLEYTQLAEYREAAGNVPVLLVEHDITFTLYRQLAASTRDEKTRLEYERWLAFEQKALAGVDAVWTMSNEDQALATEHGAPPRSTHVIPNGVDLDRFQPMEKQSATPTVLFVGSLRHLPNLLALETLRTEIMPAVWRERPDTVLHIIGGPDHERAARLANKASLLQPDPRIVIDGFVEDVRPAYRDCDVVVVPLPVSAGTNIKVMEAMACGRAIVSTSVGCQGLGLHDGRELLVADSASEFASAVVSLLADAGLRTRIAGDARGTAEQRFGWDAIARTALASYVELFETAAVPVLAW